MTRIEGIPQSSVPFDVMARFRKDYAETNVIAVERCIVSDGSVYYALRFESGGKLQEALLTQEAELLRVYDKRDTPAEP